jgi:hypothetical protein
VLKKPGEGLFPTHPPTCPSWIVCRRGVLGFGHACRHCHRRCHRRRCSHWHTGASLSFSPLRFFHPCTCGSGSWMRQLWCKALHYPGCVLTQALWAVRPTGSCRGLCTAIVSDSRPCENVYKIYLFIYLFIYF